MDEWEKKHTEDTEGLEKDIRQKFLDAILKASALVTLIRAFKKEKPFRFEDYPSTTEKLQSLLKDLSSQIESAITVAIVSEWDLANARNDALSDIVFGKRKDDLPAVARSLYYARNEEARLAFQKRRIDGLGLSERVWNLTQQFRQEIEMGIDIALRDGLSASQTARRLKQYLNEPDRLFRRVRDEHGVLHLSKAAKAYHPGQGVYRSSYRNARRLAATETNIAYRTADYLRWQQLDFVVGIEIRLSNNHTCNGKPFHDICDELKGRYPKDFKFTGWHPLCYDEDSEVYTGRGWQFFKDVLSSDRILSLDTVTRNLEYVGIDSFVSYQYSGKMVHFHNRSYSQMVTPEHEVLHLSKNQKSMEFRRTPADKCGVSQPIYRSSEWVGHETTSIRIGDMDIDFNLFAEFMGYWLSDGSIGHRYEIDIAQQDDNRYHIYRCIENMGFNPRFSCGKVEFNDKGFYLYLLQFGRCNEKYVPDIIKESTPDQIRIFLNAFISCDGHIKSPKPFVGNRGGLCSPKEGERTYYTTSVRMADDIGELILKIGRRPSFRVNSVGGKPMKFKNGEYVINHDCIVISECRSVTATQYHKDYVDYDGMVYDLTLKKNNTLYIRRKGKCFWGSNCRCYAISVLKTDEEMDEDTQKILNGEKPGTESRNAVKDVPDKFRKWIDDNKDRIARSKSLPYFMRDNEKYVPQVRVTDEALKRAQASQKFNDELMKAARPTRIRLTDEQKAHRKELQNLAIEKYRGVVIHNKFDIEVTTSGVKEYLNQPHARYFDKNESIVAVDSLLSTAKYLGINPSYNKAGVRRSHIYETSIAGVKSWLVVREYNDGRYLLYSCSDNSHIAEGLIKDSE